MLLWQSGCQSLQWQLISSMHKFYEYKILIYFPFRLRLGVYNRMKWNGMSKLWRNGKKWNEMSIINGNEWNEYSLQFLSILGGIKKISFRKKWEEWVFYFIPSSLTSKQINDFFIFFYSLLLKLLNRRNERIFLKYSFHSILFQITYTKLLVRNCIGKLIIKINK